MGSIGTIIQGLSSFIFLNDGCNNKSFVRLQFIGFEEMNFCSLSWFLTQNQYV